MKEITVQMRLKKRVVHSVVYEAKGSAVPTIYIKTDKLPNPIPESITITIKET